jgi:hypothetical protein
VPHSNVSCIWASSGWRPTHFRTRTTRITKCTTSLTTLGISSTFGIASLVWLVLYYQYLRWHKLFEYVIICLRYSLWMSGNLFQTLHKRNLTMNAVGSQRNRAGGWSHLSFAFSSFSFCFDC